MYDYQDEKPPTGNAPGIEAAHIHLLAAADALEDAIKNLGDSPDLSFCGMSDRLHGIHFMAETCSSMLECELAPLSNKSFGILKRLAARSNNDDSLLATEFHHQDAGRRFRRNIRRARTVREQGRLDVQQCDAASAG